MQSNRNDLLIKDTPGVDPNVGSFVFKMEFCAKVESLSV